MVTGFSVVFGLYGYMNPNYTYMNQQVAALYEAISRLAWALMLAWLVLTCATGYAGIDNFVLYLVLSNLISYQK